MTQDHEPSEDVTVARLAKFRAVGFFPADYAKIESGKVYASGAFWSTLQLPAFPATLPTVYLVAVIEIPFHENQTDHQIEMGMLDFDRQPTGLKVEAVFRSAPTIHARFGQAGTLPVAVPINGLVFSRTGEYTFTLSVDGKQLESYPFTVIQVPVKAMLQGAINPIEE